MIKVIDYGLGNVSSFTNAYKSLDIKCELAKSSSDLDNASPIILPGVGSFDYAMELFSNSGLRDKIEEKVLEDMIPILGVCVGMQILGDDSEEGNKNGLGWIHGSIKKINGAIEKDLPLPHMGWNSISVDKNQSLFRNVDSEKGFYFLHSYYFDSDIHQIASSNYPNSFCCAVNKDNIFGVQFHPEKSLTNGRALLKNFSEI